MAITAILQETETRLVKLIPLGDQGEETIIVQDDQPRVKLIPVEPITNAQRVFAEYRRGCG